MYVGIYVQVIDLFYFIIIDEVPSRLSLQTVEIARF